MVATTTQGLPYPTGGDRPCDSWMTWEALATTLDAKLVAVDADLDLTAYGRPIAKVSTTTAQQMPSSGPGTFVKFDTVEVDTDSMVDIVGNSQFVVPRRTGLFHVVAFANFDNLDTGALAYVALAYGAQSGYDKQVVQREFNWTLYKSGAHVESDTYLSPTLGIGIQLTSTGVIGDDPRLLSAQLSVYYIGEFA